MSAGPGLVQSIECAAADDLVALRGLASDAYDDFLAYSANAEGAVVALARSVTFARLAASCGDDRDKETLMFLLCRSADWHRAQGRDDIGTRMEAAALNVADDLADAGRDDMATMVAQSAHVLSADTFAEALRQRAEGWSAQSACGDAAGPAWLRGELRKEHRMMGQPLGSITVGAAPRVRPGWADQMRRTAETLQPGRWDYR